MKISRDQVIKEIMSCYEKQYPNRMYNFERLLGFPHRKFKHTKDSNLKKLVTYYEMLLRDMDSLIKIMKYIFAQQDVGEEDGS